MVVFEDIQDVEEWLADHDYAGFWKAIALWNVFTGDERAHYDDVIAEGVVCPDLVLSCLKEMVRLDLSQRFDLKDRTFTPPDAQYLTSLH
ncbi:hypothetical protein So717_22820 [Roseobacter cerasinus]|uniref:Uncharacterized protein n=1 Tax=Roseobacter cerasinus TaxID=2602289 RepID=A0A640VR81_9RHOB|nr:hypothetical protein [Roseobacter cerasinus]GFE50529.1 hypothetical protein So717_22820 [Roseobacter cerasinus]